MTPTERLALLRTMDHLIALLDNPCAKISAAELKQSRHALDDEAFQIAQQSATDEDEFFRGIWWVPDEAPGVLRPATGSECAAEIRRMRAELQEALRTEAALEEERAMLEFRFEEASCIDHRRLIYVAKVRGDFSITEDGKDTLRHLGDVSTSQLLEALAVPPGHYATCHSEGLFRLGSVPAGVIGVKA